jgi:hypothetical protein
MSGDGKLRVAWSVIGLCAVLWSGARRKCGRRLIGQSVF